MNEGSAGYGNVLVLEVSGEDLRNAKRDYKLEFTTEKESGAGFDINADKFYLRYAHLSYAIKTGRICQSWRANMLQWRYGECKRGS